MDYKDEEELEELEQVEYNNKLANSYYDNDFEEEEYNSRLANSYYDDEKLLNEPQPNDNIEEVGKFNDGIINDAKAIAKKAVVKKLFSSPIAWIVIGIVALIMLIFILVFQMDFDLVGVGEPSPSYYSANCNKVYLTWQKETYKGKGVVTNSSLVDLTDTERYEYEEYSIDSYLAGIIWTDNRNALDVDNLTVYEAMAIVKRSYLINNIADNCVVLRDYDDLAKNFTKLDGNEERYTDINNAIANTKGIIIARDGKIISAVYDTFSYTSRKEDKGDTSYFYHMMNENEQGEQIIPASWVTELENKKGTEINKVHVGSTKKFESLSLYGAKYLLEKVDSQYGLYRILENYFGRDIEYYTISTSFLQTSGCMWWPIGGSEITIENGVSYAKGEPTATTISSGYGIRNLSLAGASTNHQAIDISGGGLDGVHNIIAVQDGVVVAVNTGCVTGDKECGAKLGNYVKIQHSDGTITRYGHMYSVFVNVGDAVKQGQVLGKMGNTGNSTGPHLDFQVIVNGMPVNPLNYVSESSARAECNFNMEITGGYTGQSSNEFIDFIAKYAVEDMHSSNILASVTIAQAILESNWGKSTLSKNYNNFFGMKAGSSWRGQTVELPTTECDENGNCYSTTAIWRVYTNPLQSIQDHSSLLHASRYSGVVGEKDYVRAITIIKNGGYATDPNYVSKIVNLIQQYGLAKYDGM